MKDGRDGRDGKPGPRGFPGERGPPGEGREGRSAYSIAVQLGFVGSEREWVESLRGASGKDGERGIDGLPGSAGADGQNGHDGSDGKSAYQVALERGFKGSESLWLQSLKGDRGTKGEQGRPGPQGPPGPVPNHEWNGTELRFELPSGAWGEYVDLKGPPGKRGQDGGGGTSGVTNAYFPSGW